MAKRLRSAIQAPRGILSLDPAGLMVALDLGPILLTRVPRDALGMEVAVRDPPYKTVGTDVVAAVHC